MTPFATVADVATRLQRNFDSAATAAVEAMIEDATAYLRDEVIGCHVAPTVTSTITVHRTDDLGGGVRLPGPPILSVDAVTRDGHDIAHRWDGEHLAVDWGADCHPDPVQVTYTHGYATVPHNLRTWTIVLVAQAIADVEELGTIGRGGAASFSIDDYRKAWAPSETGDVGYTLPPKVRDRLRSTYGGGAHVLRGAR